MSIGNQLVFDINGNVEDFTFILSTKDFTHLGALRNVIPESVHVNGNLSNGHEVSFEVYKVVSKLVDDQEILVEEPLWDSIVDLKLIYVNELDEYFEIAVQLDDSTDCVKKTCTCTSLCRAELSNIKAYGLEINTELDISRDDYIPTVFYSPKNPKESLLNRLIDGFAPHYHIAHVDASLWNLQRMFSLDSVDLYGWMTGDCSSEFNCIFQFNTTTRGVYVYDLYTVCRVCGNRGEFVDECPNCLSSNLQYFGTDTTIYVDKENLTDAIQLTVDSGSIKNCFKLVAGDDLMTSTVRLLNMNGTDFIYELTENQLAEVPEELREKIESYNELCSTMRPEYEEVISELFEASDNIVYYTHTMMPTIEHAEVTAQTEAEKLTEINLSPLGLSSVTSSTSKATVESALKNYAKVYVKTGYVKLDVESSDFSYVGTDEDGWNYGTWTGNFKVTNYSDKEDVAYSPIISVKVTNNYQDFIEQKVLKNIANNSDEESSVFDVLSIEELDDFTEALKLYCLKRLKSFYDAIQLALDVLLEVDQASEGADLYEPFYMPYYQKLVACQAELYVRQATIDEWQNVYDNCDMRKSEIQSALNFQDYLGEDLYTTFCMYRREDTYQNDNYISDGLTDAELLQKAREFLDVAKKELDKARTPKLTISSSLYNLLLMPEFKPLIHFFKLGNWLRIHVDDTLYRLMLTGYDLSPASSNTLGVEFANVTKSNSVTSETQEILEDAQSMSKNYDYFAAQAKKGNEANVEIKNWLQDGLDSATIAIKNNNSEAPILDKHGIWGRAYDDITGNILPEQFRATHNILAFTDNNWLSTTCALGKHDYYKFNEQGKLVQDTDYGLSSKFVTAGYIYGSQIISGNIYSENYALDSDGNVISGSHIALKDGTFNFGAGSLKYDVTNGLSIKGSITSGSTITGSEIVGGSITIGDNFHVDNLGNMKVSNANISGYINATEGGNIGGWTISDNVLYDYNGTISTVGAGMQSWWYNDEYESELANLVSFWAGAPFSKRDTAPFIVTRDGNVTANNLTTSNITATGGEIGGCTIEGGILQIGNINIAERLTADAIDATSLHVSAANIDGQLVASQINTTGLIAENISGTSISGKTISGGSISGTTISGSKISGNTIDGGSISIGSSFSVNSSGVLSCSGATISGVLTAGINSSLGGFTTDSNSLYSGTWGTSSGTMPDVFMSTGTSGSYYIGGTKYSNLVFGAGGKFGVTKSGALYATSGKIGDWSIVDGTLTGVSDSGYDVELTPFGIKAYSSTYGGMITMNWDAVVDAVYKVQFNKLSLE